MIKKIQPTPLLIAIALFMMPLFGGQLSTDLLFIKPEENWLLGLTGSTSTPILAHLVAILPMLAAGILLLATYQVVILPNFKILIPLVLLMGLIFISIGFSNFKTVSIPIAAEWFCFAAMFLIVSAGLGRRGADLAIGAIVGGMSICAVMGILEYSSMRAADPGWRIFAGFNNPNAAGAAFLIGIPLAIGMTAQQTRLPQLLFGISGILQVFALLLTQSKGAFLFLGLALASLVILGLALKNRFGKGLLISTILVCSLGGGLYFGSKKAPSAAGAPQAVSRFARADESATQSAGFRKLLWQGTFPIIKTQPVGTGIGTYKYWSTRSGLTTQTQLTHNSYLQIASEASPIAALAMISFFVITTGMALRGIGKTKDETKATAAVVIAALLGILGHNLIDSDFYTFGLGALTFGLLGVLVAQSVDSTAPEYLTKPIRGGLIAAMAGMVLLLIAPGFAEKLRAEARGLSAAGRVEEARTAAESTLSLLPADGVAMALRANAATDSADALKWAKSAAETHPTPKNWRLVANLLLKSNEPLKAADALNAGLAWDPNNMAALKLLIEAYTQANEPDRAVEAAKRLVAVEETPYFKVRSQPELVPTETYEARYFLAKNTTNPEEKKTLLEAAIKGVAKYRDTTMPVILRMTYAGSPDFAGESVPKAVLKFEAALEAIKELKELYRGAEPAWLAAEATAFEEVLAKLRK